MRKLILAALLLAPSAAWAQSSPGFADCGSNPAACMPPNGHSLTASDLNAAFQHKMDLNPAQIAVQNGTAAAPGFAFSSDPTTGLFHTATGALALSQSGVDQFEANVRGYINNGGNSSISPTYFSQAYSIGDPQLTIPGAHIRMSGGYTRGWNQNTDILTINANFPTNVLGGNQGLFWDYSYRRAYNGQDGAALNLNIQGIAPIARAVSVSSFSTESAVDSAGNATTVYVTTLSAPLTPQQIAMALPMMRVETNNNFFGYLIPPGLKISGGTPIPQVSSDGTKIYTDNWTRGAPNDQEGPNVLPSSYGMTGGDSPLASYTLSIDVLHLIERTGGEMKLSDSDMVLNAYDSESTILNDHAAVQTFGSDPLSDSIVVGHDFAGCSTDSGGAGTCGFGALYTGGFKRGVVFENAPNANTGPTYGVQAGASGPTFLVYSTQSSGYLLEEMLSGSITAQIDYQGNTFFNGTLGVNGAATFTNAVKLTGTSGYPLSLQNANGNNFLVDPSGNVGVESLTSNGAVTAGTKTFATLPAASGARWQQFTCTDCLKPGQSAGNGTGMPVFSDGTGWYTTAGTAAAH